MATYYIDADAAAGGDGSSATPYNTLSAAEAARNGTYTEVITFKCGGSSDCLDTTGVTIDGGAQSSGAYLLIEADTGHRAGTAWSETKYRLEAANVNTIVVADDYVRFNGLQIGHSAIDGSDNIIIVNGVSATNDIRVANCFLKGADSTSFVESGINVLDTDVVLTTHNTIICNIGVKADTGNCGIYINSSNANVVYNCTVIGGYYGIRTLSGKNATITNCYVYGSNTALKADGTLTRSYNATNDLSSTGTGAINSITYSTSVDAGNAGFTNVSTGAQDLALLSGSTLIGHGATDPGSGLYSDDILGTARS